MLENLIIQNGDMSPAFNSEIYEYNVNTNDAISLIMDYDLTDSATITVYGNDNLSDGENHVLIEIYDGKEVKTYTLLVNNDVSIPTASFDSTYEKVEVRHHNVIDKDLITPGIIIICFLTIIVLYAVLFHKK